jgi:5-methylcytosine-specific restriction endonuclease McrA
MDSFKLSHPLCLGCQAVGRVTATEVTDHTIPAKGDVALLWNSANFQPACRWHHDVVKQKLEAQFAAGEINVEDLRLDSPRAIALTKSNDLG